MSKIKECFQSRFSNGVLMQVDFSQLEVCCLAVIAKDTVLLDELNKGEDIHTNNTVMLHPSINPEEFKKLRRRTKEFTFQLQYGAGARSISRSLGISYREASRYKEEFYKKYTGIRDWHATLPYEARDNEFMGQDRTPLGYPAREAYLRSITGRYYKHIQRDGPSWDASTPGFSPTELRNYRVQGLAGGDIQPLANCMLYRKLIKDKLYFTIKLINTVHDSVILDIKRRSVMDCFRLIKSTYKDIKGHVERVYGMRFTAPLNYDVEIGYDLQNLTEVDIDDVIYSYDQEDLTELLATL